MNCHNSDTYLREAIDSVYAQTFTDWEIIFWDNASTDKSAQIAQSYDSKLQDFLLCIRRAR
jgi:glycosyltransferase involved in cell wall biosynthesis